MGALVIQVSGSLVKVNPADEHLNNYILQICRGFFRFLSFGSCNPSIWEPVKVITGIFGVRNFCRGLFAFSSSELGTLGV